MGGGEEDIYPVPGEGCGLLGLIRFGGWSGLFFCAVLGVVCLVG